MHPRWHLILGAVFAFVLWASVPSIHPLYPLLFFLATVFIDFDHYVCAVLHTGQWGLRDAFAYHRRMDEEDRKRKMKGLRERGDFHLFHTIAL